MESGYRRKTMSDEFELSPEELYRLSITEPDKRLRKQYAEQLKKVRAAEVGKVAKADDTLPPVGSRVKVVSVRHPLGTGTDWKSFVGKEGKVAEVYEDKVGVKFAGKGGELFSFYPDELQVLTSKVAKADDEDTDYKNRMGGYQKAGYWIFTSHNGPWQVGSGRGGIALVNVDTEEVRAAKKGRGETIEEAKRLNAALRSQTGKMAKADDKPATLRYHEGLVADEKANTERMKQNAIAESARAGEDEAGAPNLDAMSESELRQFVAGIGNGTRPMEAARRMFPDQGDGAVRATLDLRNYAWNKITAMSLRAEGDIPQAKKYEDICDSIYSKLPQWARW
jgi:hypothetical protein